MVEPKDVTAFTAEANQAMLDQDRLDWENKEDWEDAQKGFIARLDPRSSRAQREVPRYKIHCASDPDT